MWVGNRLHDDDDDEEDVIVAASSDHGRAGTERRRPRSRRSPPFLRGHQVGRGGLRGSVHQNFPEQNLPRLPAQEETREKQQELDGRRPSPLAGAEVRLQQSWRP